MVYCGTKDGNTTITLSEDESVCNADMKLVNPPFLLNINPYLFVLRPESEQECQGTEECTGTWFTSVWSQCTATCGGGTYKRTVKCLHNGEPVAPDQCDAEAIPAEDGDCNTEDCPEASGEEESDPPDYESTETESETCKEYYDDYWIFGEEASGEGESETEDEDEGSGSGSGEKGTYNE